MKTGPKALALIKSFEGLRLKAYPDPATGGEPITIGYGYTNRGVVRIGDVITDYAADALLQLKLREFEEAVTKLLNGSPTDAAQFGAMVSLCYNIGVGNFTGSSVLRLHKIKDYLGAKAAFASWNKANGQVMAGLSRRRKAEAELYGLYLP